MNCCQLSGRTTTEITLKTLPGGAKVATFSMAIKRIGTSNGNQDTDFFNCEQIGKGAESTAKYVKKGARIIVMGEVRKDRVETVEGIKYYDKIKVNSVEYLENKKEDIE